MFYKIIQRLKIRQEQKKWRKNNAHNQSALIQPIQYQECIQVGKYTYGGLHVINHNTDEKLIIGNFCSIAPNVCFILNGDHNINTVSTYPYKVMCLGIEKNEAVSKGNIIVDDDVWIGYGATIMSGVHIGQGAVVAAGAVVTKDIPPYAIVGGIPATVIKHRFSDEIIEELLKVDYSQLDEKMIQQHIDDLYQNFTNIEQISWMPRKKK